VSRVRYKRHQVLASVICLALAGGAGAFGWLVLGAPVEQWFRTIGGAISRAGG
jgi:hypothetical protein